MKSIFRKILILLFCVYLIYGCKKEEIPFVQYENTHVDQLTGDTSIFVGVWNWIFTSHYYGWCDNESYYESLTPSTENIQFRLQFFESGQVHYFKNDSLIGEYRILFEYFDINSIAACGVEYKQFSIGLNGFKELNLSGCISNDTLQCHAPGFIFYPVVGCENYVNIFAKE